MRLLLDSHTVFWMLYAPEKLPQSLHLTLENPAHELFVSHVSIWELINKAVDFRLPLAGSSAESIVSRIRSSGVDVVPIELSVIVESAKLPRHHGDPFDRFLIAQAIRLNASLVSRDGKFRFYDVPVIWS